jgi:hypothetical protein
MGFVWLVLSGLLVLLAAAFLLNFPYIPLLFGLQGAAAHSLRGRMLAKALSLVPVLALACIGLGWLLSPAFFLLPFAALALIWLLRPTCEPERTSRFANSEENRALLARSLSYELRRLEPAEAAGHYMLCTLLCPSESIAQHICHLLAHLPLHSAAQIKSFAEDTLCELRIRLISLEQVAVATLVDEINQCAWSNQSIVSSLSILRD